MLRKDICKAADLADSPRYGIDAEDGDQGNGNGSEHSERLDADVSCDGHDNAGDDNQQPDGHFAAGQAGHRDRKHRNTHAEPADLCEADERRGQQRAFITEGTVREQVKRQTCLLADVT